MQTRSAAPRNAKRLIVGNLDCEQEYAHPGAARALPAPVRHRISAAASLLAVFGRPGDALWTPEPIDTNDTEAVPARVHVPGAADMHFISGPLAHINMTHGNAGALLCWAETQTTAMLRSGATQGPEPKTWPEALWHVRADPTIARRCNDRRYCLTVARDLGMTLPGAAVLDSVDALEAHLARGWHSHGQHGAWVLEAPFSASGRLRLRRRGPALDHATRSRAARLFAAHDELVFQPWMNRVFDIGCLGLISGPDRWQLLSPHWLDIDHAGVFRGIVVAGPETWPQRGAIAGAIHMAADKVRDTAARVAHRLARDGYRGPFGIDGFVYRDRDDQLVVHPMCEINARLSFGFVAHALALAHPGHAVRFCLGTGSMPDPSPGVIPLLGPGTHDPTVAWIELDPVLAPA